MADFLMREPFTGAARPAVGQTTTACGGELGISLDVQRSLLMRSIVFQTVVALSVVAGSGALARADDYVIDSVHSGVSFQISHLGLSYIQGRFNEFTGNFAIDTADPARSSFSLTIKTESVDTNNSKRDEHLRAPDFFNAKQFPAITFTSTSVKAVEGGYDVTGDLSMHGETKPVTFTLKGGKTGEFPPKVIRTGFTTSQIVVKRSEFGVGKPMPVLGDDVYVAISFEGTKK
jgi:polyisoprenoid-binding protein YceI